MHRIRSTSASEPHDIEAAASMKLLIVDTYYPAFLRVFYDEHPGLQSRPYAEQWRILMDQCFGTANFYSDNLRPLGFDAHEVVANCDPLQRRWAREHALPLWAAYPLYRRSGRVKAWQMAVLKAQVVGNRSEYLRFAFEPRVQKLLGEVQPRHAVVFVGGYSPNHANGNRLLEHVAARSTVDFWGYGAESLPANSLVRRSCRGEAWGLQMYGVLAESRISLNRHIDVAGRFANNMRLFEATGVGTLLLTDQKDNLHQLFEVGKEVIAYSTPQECAELITYYLDHEDERRAVARAGQERTLRDHTYQLRMKELAQIVREHQT